MTSFTVQQVLDSTGAVLVRGEPGAKVEGVSTDTRLLKPGQLFLALSGPNFDGNVFAQAALESGAGALVLQHAAVDPTAELRGDAPIALHPNPRRALGDFAAWHRSLLEIPVIGVTGSCGKTTTKNMLRTLLGSTRRTVASPSSFNNDIGVPHTLLLADRETEALVVELGTNGPGEIAALCRIARPTVGIITNVGASHLEGLGSIEGVAREKGDLAAALPRDGVLVLNADCRFTQELRSMTSARVLTFSVAGDGDLDARDLEFHSAGTSFRLHGLGLDGVDVTSPLLGTHNVQNLLAALVACSAVGADLPAVLPAIAQLADGRQRMERFELPGLTLYDDSYNANPESARAAVRVLSGLHGHARRVLVLGDMLELGEFAAELHHAIGMEAAAAGIDRLVLVGNLVRAAAAGALEGGLPEAEVFHFESAELAAGQLPGLLAAGDVVLVKGSRAMALDRLVTAIRAGVGAAAAGLPDAGEARRG